MKKKPPGIILVGLSGPERNFYQQTLATISPGMGVIARTTGDDPVEAVTSTANILVGDDYSVIALVILSETGITNALNEAVRWQKNFTVTPAIIVGERALPDVKTGNYYHAPDIASLLSKVRELMGG